jgi:tetratricopeptide (TPR) repeat protein
VVVDWGLAKDLYAAGDETDAAAGSTDSQLTRAGSVMGTPVYMPVEQARGEPLDERADVYALGAILYHLIAGVPPYRARTADDVLELVRDKPPIGLGELEVDVPDDLVAIVEVAMARDREDRYPSGVELAAELERFSTGQLVGAHRYSAWALVRRWMARHRAAVITALVGLVALAAVSLFMVREILEERDGARAARADAELQRQRAEGLVDFMLADLRGKLAPAGQMALLENVAERAGAYANKVPDEVDGAIDRRRRVAELVGDVRTTGDLEGAERAFRSELELARQLAAREGNEAAQKAIAAAHRHIAEALAERGERSAALEELEDATEALAGLPREIAADVLGKIRSTEGTIRFLDRDIDGAREAFEIAGELLGADWERRGKPADAALGVLQIEGRLADIDLATGRPAAALERYDKLIDGIDQAPAPEGFRSYIRAKLGLKRGNALAALDRDEEALAAFAESAAIVERLSRDDPENHSLLYDRSVALANQADHLETKPEVAAAKLREAIGVMKRAVDGSDNAEWQGHLGALHGRLGELLAEKRRPGARAELERAVEILGELEASGRLVEVEGHRAAFERARQALSKL